MGYKRVSQKAFFIQAQERVKYTRENIWYLMGVFMGIHYK